MTTFLPSLTCIPSAQGCLILLFASCLLGRSSAAESSGKNPLVLLERADAQLSEGHTQEALDTYTQCLRQIEKDDTLVHLEVTIRLKRGNLMLSLRRNEEAITDFAWIEKAMSGLDPTNRYLRAVATLDRVICQQNLRRVLEPDLTECNHIIADMKDLLEHHARDSWLREGVRQQIGVTFYIKADIYANQRNFPEAVAAGRDSLASLPESESYWRAKANRMLGEILAKGPEWKEGMNYLYASLTLFSQTKNAEAMEEILYILAQYERDPSQAEAIIRQYAALPYLGTKDTTYFRGNQLVHLTLLRLKVLNDDKGAAVSLREFEDGGFSMARLELAPPYYVAKAILSIRSNDFRMAHRAIESYGQLDIGEAFTRDYDSTMLEVQLSLLRSENDLAGAMKLGDQLVDKAFAGQEDGKGVPKYIDKFSVALILSELAEILISLGRPDVGVDLARKAIPNWEDLGYTNRADVLKILYARAWLEYDPLGNQETNGIPEWKRVLDDLEPRLGTLGPLDRQNYHLIRATGLMQRKDFAGAKKHLDSLAALAPERTNDIAFILPFANLLLEGDEPSAARQLLLPIRSGELNSNEQLSLFALRIFCACKLKLIDEVFNFTDQALVILDRLSAQSPVFAYQTALRDYHSGFLDEAIKFGLQKTAMRTPDDTRLLTLILRTEVPAAIVQRVPLTAGVFRKLDALAINRKVLEGFDMFEKRFPQTRTDRKELLTRFHLQFSEYYAQFPISTNEVIRDRSAHLLEFFLNRTSNKSTQVRVYYIGTDTGAVYIIENGQVSARHLIPGKAIKALEHDIKIWREAMLNMIDDSPSALSIAKHLSEVLFPEGWQTTPQTIEILPHGPLWLLPFQSLVVSNNVDGSPSYLDEGRNILYFSPAGLTKVTSQSQSNRRTNPPESLGWFFINPALSEKGFQPVRSGVALKSNLVSFNPSLARRVLEGTNALEELLYRSEYQNARWLHFITHTKEENDWEDHVGLLLAADPDTTTIEVVPAHGNPDFPTLERVLDFRKDGFLPPREIETFDLRSDFVFLQGCQTLKGRTSYSGGLAGLLSAFLAAGSKRVIATHWAVPDDETVSKAIAQFYVRQLQDRQSPEESLWQLRRDLRKGTGIGRRPYAWAVFSLYY